VIAKGTERNEFKPDGALFALCDGVPCTGARAGQE